MFDEARKMLKFAENKCDYVQINIDTNDEKSISLMNNNIDLFQNKKTTQYSIKVWIKGKEGSSYSNNFDMDTVKKAIKIAKLNSKKEYFYGLPKKQDYKQPDIFDKRIEALSEEKLIDMSKKILDETSDNKVKLSSGDIDTSISEGYILNSNGIEAVEKASDMSINIGTVAKSGKNISSWYDYKQGNRIFDVREIGKKAKEKTLLYLDAKKIAKKPKVVVLNTRVLAQLLNYSFLPNLNGKNVEKHKSLFCGKINEKVLDKNMSIYDNGTLNKGLQSAAFDSEGTASKNTCLVKDGVIKNFIYDFNTAKNNNTASTGNASNGDIDFTNVVIKAPKKDIKDALFIESIMGAHTSNSLTTDFSVKVEHGMIDNKPVKDFMISGKMIDVLNNIISMGKKVEQKGFLVSGSLATNRINIIK